MIDWYKRHPKSFLLLLICLSLGFFIRLIHLTDKPIWSDEFATLVFSLGQGFREIPLNQMIDVETLLSPLKLNSDLGIQSVYQRLFAESNHPPLYFMLTHEWVKLFSQDGDWVSIWGARFLSVLFGTFSIPAIFILSLITFRSHLVGQFAALLMAVSPFSLYLSQEARHYTLPILLIILSLCFLILALRRIQQHQMFSFSWSLSWIIINTLGIATHFFFALTLCAEAFVVLGFGIYFLFLSPNKVRFKFWSGIYIAAIGTVIGGLVWLPLLFSFSQSKPELVDWTFHGNPVEQFLEPIGRIITWIITMVVIFPVENQSLGITIISGLGMLSVVGLIVKLILKYWKAIIQFCPISVYILLGFVGSAILVILILTYSLGMDLTLVSRYQFIYFPAIICLIAAILAMAWQQNQQYKIIVTVIILASFLSSLGVVHNLAYQKPDRSDLVAAKMAKISSNNQPTLIATVYKSHEQAGEMMSLAWELKKLGINGNFPQFLLAQKNGNPAAAMETLNQALTQLPRPMQLWTVNFAAPFEPEQNHCQPEPNSKLKASGYSGRMYRCL